MSSARNADIKGKDASDSLNPSTSDPSSSGLSSSSSSSSNTSSLNGNGKGFDIGGALFGDSERINHDLRGTSGDLVDTGMSKIDIIEALTLKRKLRKVRVSNKKAIVIGVSAGGLAVMKTLIPALPKDFPLPIIIVQHVRESGGDYLARSLNENSELTVCCALDKTDIEVGHVYVAPADYHLLIERDCSFSLSSDDKVRYSRPSIDVLFESAADAYGDNLTAIILTGANSDGTKGAETIKKYGGLVIVQDPDTAEASMMPRSVVNAGIADEVFSIEGLIAYLLNLGVSA